MVNGAGDNGVIQVKAKKKMQSGMKGGKRMKGTDGMKGGGMKGMKGM